MTTDTTPRPTASRDEGSIILAVLVIFIAGALVATTAVIVQSSLRVSRRQGDSANALQLADAAVNDAVKAVSKATSSTVTASVDLPANGGTYTYKGTLDTTSNVWHIDAIGTDHTGVKRHVRADAVPEPLVGSAYFANSNVTFPAGTSLDSFQNGSSQEKMCTRHGFLGSNDLTINWPNSGGGSGTRNCTQTVYGATIGTWPYPMDGCTFYAGNVGDPPPTVPSSNIGSGKCPEADHPAADGSNAVSSHSPQFVIPDPPLPASPPWSNGNDTNNPGNVCDSTHPLVGRTTPYYWNTVNLFEGCFVNVANGPVIMVTKGSVIIGAQNGNAGAVDVPDTSTNAVCPNYGGQDTFNDPAWYYCPGWAKNLQIYIKGANSVTFGNHAKFWGVVIGPDASVGGGPYATIWGALLTGGTAGSAQFTMHYDEALGDITTGRYLVANWREEPLS
jgi:hypothetical protein